MTRQTIFSDVHPNARDLRWFAQLGRHGPQSSTALFEQTRTTHRCKDTALRRLQALREAGYLRLPPQQQGIAKASFNPHVYDLTPQGFEVLSYHQPLERHARPTGHWWHGFWVASVTGAIETLAVRSGIDFIEANRILALQNASLGIPIKLGTVVPDQIFALKTARGFLSYALEVDRGTEPVRSNAARKSLQRSVSQYREILTHKLYRSHYGLKSNLLVIWVHELGSRRATPGLAIRRPRTAHHRSRRTQLSDVGQTLPLRRGARYLQIRSSLKQFVTQGP